MFVRADVFEAAVSAAPWQRALTGHFSDPVKDGSMGTGGEDTRLQGTTSRVREPATPCSSPAAMLS